MFRKIPLCGGTGIVKRQLLIVLTIVVLPLYVSGQIISKSLSINSAVEIGLKNNPEVKIAVKNISVSKGKFWSGISLPQPEVSFSYEYVPANSSLKNFGERTFEVSQSFEFPSNYFLKGSKQSKEEEIAVHKLKLTERSVIKQVKTSYYKALTKKYQVKFATENLNISADFLKKAEIRQNVGEGTNLESLTAKVQYTEAINNLEVAKNELKTALAELNYSLGYGEQNYVFEYQLTDSLVFVEHRISLEQIYKLLEEANPQVKIAELNYGIASVENSLAWSSILPNFNLAYFKQSLGGDNGFYGASFGISVPLWFVFDQRGQIQETTAKQSISESEIQLAKNEIALKVKSVITDYENNFKQVELYMNEIIPQAEEIYRTALKSYDAGELTYLEYLQAKQTLISSRNNYINALFNLYTSQFQIEEIIGQSINKTGQEK